MRIAFYSDTYLPAVDGVVTSMLNFKKGLERKGHEVFIFSSSTRQNKKRYSSDDVFLYDGIKFRPYPQYSSAIFPYHSITKLVGLDIDIIHAQSPFMMGFNGLLAAKLGGYPIAATFHTMYNDKSLSVYYPKAFRSIAQKYLWSYIKFFFNRCDVSIAPSDEIYDMLRSQGIRRVEVVPNSVDSDVYNPRVSPEAARRALKLRSNEKVVLYLGRVSKEKKIDVFLKAAAALSKKRKDVRFVVGGTGPMLDQYQRQARRLGLSDRITFTGFVQPNLLPSLYASAEMLCLPSTFETQGVVCIEAMATGKPVVGSNSPVLRGIVRSGVNGELFARDDYRSCALKMEKVLNNDDAYKRGAIDTAKEFSLDKTTRKLLDVYTALLKGRFTG